MANGPMDIRYSYTGAIDPLGDGDLFLLHLPQRSDVRIQVWGPDGPGTCDSQDSYLLLMTLDSVPIGRDDNSGPLNCPDLNPQQYPVMRQLAAGDYLVRPEDYGNDSVIDGYQLHVSIGSVCGNGMVEGYEACDGTAGCEECQIPPVCGNGLVERGEQCDDGNLTPTDGCDDQCRILVDHRCVGARSVCTPVEIRCDDAVDNDQDGNTDGADSDCNFSSLVTACGAGQATVVLTSRDTPRAIADPGTSTSVMWLPAGLGTVQRVTVKLNIAHAYPQEVAAALVAPSNAQVQLVEHQGSPGAGYLGTVLDDECTMLVSDGNTPFTGCFHPVEDLAVMDGVTAEGPWTLVALDNFGSHPGTIPTWSLRLCTEP